MVFFFIPEHNNPDLYLIAYPSYSVCITVMSSQWSVCPATGLEWLQWIVCWAYRV